MRKAKKENGSETQHANFWKPNGALGFTCEFGCFSIASDKKYAETPYQRPPAKTLAPTRKWLLQHREHSSLLQEKSDALVSRAQLAPTRKW